jgi:hypothetical protein
MLVFKSGTTGAQHVRLPRFGPLMNSAILNRYTWFGTPTTVAMP